MIPCWHQEKLECAVKKGRHRRFEEARALKRSGPDVNIEAILGSDEDEEDTSVNGRAGWYDDDDLGNKN